MVPNELRQLDKAHFWHPFTQMREWMDSDEDPVVIDSGRGVFLTDTEGREYLDGNSSIWTNVHGHCHPVLTRAIQEQAARLAHSSALGYSNEPAIRLAAALAGLFPEGTLEKVFYSDDGSTAVECACKMAVQFRQLTGEPERQKFLCFDGAYHGDTVGAASLGGIGLFHGRFASTGYETLRLESVEQLAGIEPAEVNAAVIEPLVQGANGMSLWPEGLLRTLREWCDEHGVFLILDEVLTGFGRTGSLFACEQEEVIPDFLCLAKGLTGGTLPLAATLTTERVFDVFLGRHEDQRTFFYGHSYCGNPLGCAAALANLEIFEQEQVIEQLPEKVEAFRTALERHFAEHPAVAEIRQVGLVAGVEIGGRDSRERIGARACRAARGHGLLTRAIGDVLTLLPPLVSSAAEIEAMAAALRKGLDEVVG